jgi:hypothetical protein
MNPEAGSRQIQTKMNPLNLKNSLIILRIIDTKNLLTNKKNSAHSQVH